MSRARSCAMRWISAGIMTFSSAVKSGSRWWNWNTKPILRLRNSASRDADIIVSSSPSNWIDPEVGRSRVPSSCRNVDLPTPDAPTMAIMSPASSVTSMSHRMGSALPPWKYDLPSRWTTMRAPRRGAGSPEADPVRPVDRGDGSATGPGAGPGGSVAGSAVEVADVAEVDRPSAGSGASVTRESLRGAATYS